MTGALRVQRGGQGAPVLLLLHGLGANGDVWHGLHQVLSRRWSGSWVTPDLPGHGGSAPLSTYSFDQLADAVAQSVPSPQPILVLGHSLGGVVGLALASGRFGPSVAAVSGLGIKVTWTEDELARARALGAKPNPVYPSRAEAVDRYLKVAGLTGLVAPDAVTDVAVRPADGGWSASFDPKAFTVGAPEMTGLIDAARGEVILAAGERDHMCGEEQLRRLVPDPVILPGLGHNAHVEAPEALWPLIERLREATG
jgi:pimeloyl-ACP methyl ester carboxylesterase